jgi:iron-sulfur cluster assembly protein
MSKVKNIINLTQTAIKQLQQIQKPNHILRFSVKGGGCAGMKQDLSYVPKNKLDKYDEVVKLKDELGDLEVAVDKHSIMNLMGTTIDYEETIISSGFTINNPNVTQACGCGESVIFK